MDLILQEDPTEKTMYQQIGMCQHICNWLLTYCRCSDSMFYKMVLGAHNEERKGEEERDTTTQLIII